MKHLFLTALLALASAWAAPDLGARSRDYAKRMTGFAGGVVLADAFRGATLGDTGAIEDALVAPAEPEFLIGLLTFERAHHYGESLLSKVPGLQGPLGSAIKGNLALTGALTVVSAFEVDLGDEPGLHDARIKVHELDAGSLGITAASFAAAQPAWGMFKRVAARFAKAVAARFARTAALKAALAAAPVPGSRVAALGVLLWDLGAAAVDLAGVLTLAHAVEAPLQDLRRGLQSRDRADAARARIQAALDAEDPRALEAALGELARSYVSERNRAYEEVAARDFALLQRLRRRGAPPESLAGAAQRALDDYGADGALVAQRVYLEEELAGTPYAAELARDGGLRTRREQTEVALRRREALYAQELAELDAWEAQTSPRLAQRLRDLRDLVEGARVSERALVPVPPSDGLVHLLSEE
ncbi:MAG: hypothetical protein R3F62_26285 [Planctomycetota bacterium]